MKENTKDVDKWRTPHGDLPKHLIDEYMRVSGNIVVDGEWTVEFDKVEYFHLVDPSARDESKKWKKKMGMLPVREYNFTYANYKMARAVRPASGQGWTAEYDPEAALKYAKKRLFRDGEPIYLPEMLAYHDNPMRDIDEKPPKGYVKILDEEKANLAARTVYKRS